jgi:glyoxylase I family protein
VKHNTAVGIWHYSCGGSTLIDLIAVDGPLGEKKGAPPALDSAHNVDHICIKVDPWVEADIVAHLTSIGVKAQESVTRFGADGNGPSIYIEDPEGNGLELKGRVWPIDEA